ncbi:PEGA domain-containing protein [Candidatus Saccharibacteria bacterium]|nr:PEGA domain-containing protein [Candidatus Saccharibacteria bacterium]
MVYYSYMYRRRSKRVQRTLFIMTYTVVPLLIVSSVVLLVLFTQGYRFNRSSGDVFQAGLVQFDTEPNGATVYVDGAALAARTRTRINVSNGVRTIDMKRDGYVPWQKTVNVVPGSVLWLTYARLVANDVTTEKLYDYASVANVLVDTQKNLFGLQPSASEPTFVTIPATDGAPTRTNTTVPASLYEAAEKQRFTATEWSLSGRYVLFRHDVGSVRDWLVLDTSTPAESINISDTTGATISDAFFDVEDDRYIYLLTNSSLVRFNRSDLTTSAILIKNVQTITQSADGTIVTVSKTDSGETRVSYVTHAAQTARQVVIVGDQNIDAIQSATVVTYDRRDYIALLANGQLLIARTGLDSSETTAPLEFAPFLSVDVSTKITRLEPSPNGRFVTLIGADRVSMYDLDLRQLSPTIAQYSSAPSFQWLDDYHLVDRRDASLSMFEFDGANRTPIAAVASKYNSVLSESGEYIYLLQQDADGYYVARARLLAD